MAESGGVKQKQATNGTNEHESEKIGYPSSFVFIRGPFYFPLMPAEVDPRCEYAPPLELGPAERR
jgi:hypothetical protein